MLSLKSKLPFGILLASLTISVFGNAYAQSPDWLWAKAMSGTQASYPNGIAVDPATGDVYTVGEFFGTVDFDPDPSGIFNLTAVLTDCYISKVDSLGNFLWAKRIGGGDWDFGNSIALDPVSGDVYTTGYFFGTVDFDPSNSGVFNIVSHGDADIFISKLDGAGNFIWAKSIGGSGEEWDPSLAVDPVNRDLYIKGTFKGTVDFDLGPGIFNLTSNSGYVMFITKLDDSGNFVWANRIGGAESIAFDNSIGCMAIDPIGSGTVYTTGHFKGTVDFDQGTGIFNLTSAGDDDIFISKLDASGNLLWAKSIGGTLYDGVHTIALDALGNVYITGLFKGTADFDPGPEIFNLSADSTDIFISKLDSLGNFIWAKQMEGPGADKGYSIAIDLAGSGDVYTTGYFSETVDFDPGAGAFPITSAGGWDIFISRLNDQGDFVWAKAIGGSGDERGNAIVLDALGQVHLTGHFHSPQISFGSTTLTNGDITINRANIFIAKLDTAFTTSVAGVIKHALNIYPNPAANELTIEFDEGEFLTVGITMFNILGEVVFSSTKERIVHQQTIDISHLATGIYFIELNMDGERVVKKVVKE